MTVKEERTPVWVAAFAGHVDVVKFLVLEGNADPNKAAKVWSSLKCVWTEYASLCVCECETNVWCLKASIYFTYACRLHVPLYSVKSGATPVFVAAQNGHLNVVKFLVLEGKADPTKPLKVWSRP